MGNNLVHFSRHFPYLSVLSLVSQKIEISLSPEPTTENDGKSRCDCRKMKLQNMNFTKSRIGYCAREWQMLV